MLRGTILKGRLGWGLACAAVATLLLTAGCEGLVYETREKHLSLEYVPETGLEVRSANGSVEVRPGTEPTIMIRALIRARPGRGDQVSVRAERGAEGTLVLTTDWPDGRRQGGEGCSFAVTTPPLSGVKVRTSNGRIEISGMGGPADLETSNGRITLADHAGDARLDTSNGSVKALGVGGSLDIDTSNGSILVSGVRGPVTAKSSNGSLSFTLGEGFQGPLQASSSNGSITLRLGKGVAGRFTLSTSNGGVHVLGRAAQGVEVRRRGATVTLADGPLSTLESSNGSIRVILPDALTENVPPPPAARDSAPVVPAGSPLVGSGVLPPPR